MLKRSRKMVILREKMKEIWQEEHQLDLSGKITEKSEKFGRSEIENTVTENYGMVKVREVGQVPRKFKWWSIIKVRH